MTSLLDITTLEEFYDACCADPTGSTREHLPMLRDLASKCDCVVEIGVWQGISSAALILGCKGYVYSYDITKFENVDRVMGWAGGRWVFRQASSLNVDIPECGLLFIDGWHTGAQLSAELERHAGKVKSWIVMHDTETFGTRGEDGGPGLWGALTTWLDAHPEWHIRAHLRNCNGLTILERT